MAREEVFLGPFRREPGTPPSLPGERGLSRICALGVREPAKEEALLCDFEERGEVGLGEFSLFGLGERRLAREEAFLRTLRGETGFPP